MAQPVEMQRKLRQLDNDVQSIYEMLASIAATQTRHGNRFEEQGRVLDDHTRTLAEHTRVLDQHTITLDGHTRTLDEHSRALDEHGRKLDTIIGLLTGESTT